MIDIYELTFRRPLLYYHDTAEMAKSIESFNRIKRFPISYYVVRLLKEDHYDYVVVFQEPPVELTAAILSYIEAETEEYDGTRFITIADLDEEFIKVIEAVSDKANSLLKVPGKELRMRIEKGAKVTVSEGDAHCLVGKSSIPVASDIFRYLYEKYKLFEILFVVSDTIYVIPGDIFLSKFKTVIEEERIASPAIAIDIYVSPALLNTVSMELLDEFTQIYKEKIVSFEKDVYDKIIERLEEIAHALSIEDEIDTIKEVMEAMRIDVSIRVLTDSTTHVEMDLFGKKYSVDDIPSDVVITSMIYKYYNVLMWNIVDKVKELIENATDIEELSAQLSEMELTLDIDRLLDTHEIGLESKNGILVELEGGDENE